MAWLKLFEIVIDIIDAGFREVISFKGMAVNKGVYPLEMLECVVLDFYYIYIYIYIRLWIFPF